MPEKVENETHETLLEIQSVLKAPKNQHNEFGNFDYRSAEDILNALKPILKAYHATLILSDEPILIGDWHYIKATATLTTPAGTYKATAAAREAIKKKGMDESQISGTASSYARKYALNGLFLIDDTKDTDTNEYQQQTRRQAPSRNNSALNAKKKLVQGMYSKIAKAIKGNPGDVRKEAIKQAATKPQWPNADDSGKQALLLGVLNEMEKALVKK